MTSWYVSGGRLIRIRGAGRHITRPEIHLHRYLASGCHYTRWNCNIQICADVLPERSPSCFDFRGRPTSLCPWGRASPETHMWRWLNLFPQVLSLEFTAICRQIPGQASHQRDPSRNQYSVQNSIILNCFFTHTQMDNGSF